MLCYVIPNRIKWFYLKNIVRAIQTFPLKNQFKTAFLCKHNSLIRSTKSALLLIHGDYSHPSTMLDFVDVARTGENIVYNLHLPFEEHQLQNSVDLIKQAIDAIENDYQLQNAKMDNLILAGHSKGATLSAYQAFIGNDTRIKSIIAIAGRFKNTYSEKFEPLLETLSKAISKNSSTAFFQIVAGKDWKIPLDASIGSSFSNKFYVVNEAMHLNVLFKQETLQQFRKLLLEN